MDARSDRRHQGLPPWRAVRSLSRTRRGQRRQAGRDGLPEPPRIAEQPRGRARVPLPRRKGPGRRAGAPIFSPLLTPCHVLIIDASRASQRPLSDPTSPSRLLKLEPTALASLALLESREAAHSSHDLSGKISQRLGLTAPPVRMDSQAKYCALARGEGGILLRLPIAGQGYREKIWVRWNFLNSILGSFRRPRSYGNCRQKY